MVSVLYDSLYFAALLVGWPWLLWRRWKRGAAALPLRELLGRVPARRVSAHCVWIHGVSLGEINATRSLVTELRTRAPDAAVVISSTTATGLARARELYPRLLTFRFPADISPALRPVFYRLRPSVIVLMELEAWPNLIEVAGARDVPVLIANGRITEEKSMRRFRWPVLRWVARRMFSRIRWIGAQDATYAGRFVELGAVPARVEVTGSLKYDTADLSDEVEGQRELAQEMGLDSKRPLWVCGSTGPGEEQRVLDAYARLLATLPGLQLAIVPRKPERFDEVARLIVSRGYACLRRSTGAPIVPAVAGEATPVFLGDTMGELRKFYALATVVLVGRTLEPQGGSDVMEVAGLAKAMVVGPHHENFTEAVNLLVAEGGCHRLADADALAGVVSDLLRHPERRARMGAAGRAAIAARRGATRKTVDRILELCEE